MKRWLGIATALLVLGASGSLIAVYVSTASRPATTLESTLQLQGLRVLRATATPLASLRSGAAPALVVVASDAPLADGERSRLQSFVEQGGELWVVSTTPSNVLWGDLRGLATLPGILFATDGGDPSFTLDGAHHAASGLLALDLNGTRFESAAATSFDSFRDTNANGRLETGEPSGPFTVIATQRAGLGAVTVIASTRADPLPAATIAALSKSLRPDATALLVVNDDRAAGARLADVTIEGLSLPGTTLAPTAVVVLAAAAALLLTAIGDRHAPPRVHKARALVASYEETRAALAGQGDRQE